MSLIREVSQSITKIKALQDQLDLWTEQVLRHLENLGVGKQISELTLRQVKAGLKRYKDELLSIDEDL